MGHAVLVPGLGCVEDRLLVRRIAVAPQRGGTPGALGQQPLELLTDLRAHGIEGHRRAVGACPADALVEAHADDLALQRDRLAETGALGQGHPDVLARLQGVLFVRLDADSKQKIVTPDGKLMTTRQWMDELGLTYRPSLVMFNEGRELFRADGIKYHHHLSEGLAYVKSGYRDYPVLRDFKKAYRARMMENGRNVDFSE